MVIWCELHCVNSYFRSAINIINTRAAVTEQAMDGQWCAVLGKVQTQTSKPQKNLSKQNLSRTPLCIRHWAALNPRMWWENPHAEVQEPKSTAQTQVWAGLPCSELHMNRSANETNQNDYLQNGCGSFPTWIYLTDIEPSLFIFAKTEQRTVASTVLSGIWFG